jgi:hypothetical protein
MLSGPGAVERLTAAAVSVLLPLLLGLVLLVSWQRGFQLAFSGPYGQTVNDVVLGELLPGQCPGQTFVADAPGLYRIDVLLATYARSNHGPLTLHVRGAPFAAVDWATVSVDMSTVVDNAFQAFTFNPLPLPAGVPAFFCLEAPAAAPGNAVTLLPRQADSYLAGRALWGAPAGGPEPAATPMSEAADLTFRLYYQPGATWAISAGLARLAADKPGLLGQPAFYRTLFMVYTLGLMLLTGLLARWVLFTRWLRPATEPRA